MLTTTRPSAKLRRMRELRMFLDSRDFYESAQLYRHAPALSPSAVVDAYEAMKNLIIAELGKLK